VPKLQERLPFRLLPKTLVVHDPSMLLTARYNSGQFRDGSKEWSSKDDIVSIYRLELSDEGRKKLQAEDDEIAKRHQEETEAFSKFLETPNTETVLPVRERGLLIYMEEHGETGQAPPALFFTFEPQEVKKPVDETHIYLSPDHLIGTGNHSYAFDVNWEVPRSMIVDDLLCKVCVMQKGFEIVGEEDGENGEKKDPQWKELSGEVIDVHDNFPGVSVSAITAEGAEILNEDGDTISFDILPRRARTEKLYHGPLRVIHTGVEWQNPEKGEGLCKHLSAHERPDSLMGVVSVVAKLSHPADDHLAHEAEVYQSFPQHFFQHFTGYNQLRPLRDPFPIGALVPQFYGYYVPEEGTKPMVFDRNVSGSGLPGEEGRKKWKETEEDYKCRSPIMLLEHCGRAVPNDISELSIDER
jgi:hypothetical protein